LGLLITVVGFALTLWRVRKSEKASELARKAAEGVREQILQMNAVQSLNDAMAALQDIRRLHHLGAWPALPDRYTLLRRGLIVLKGRTPGLSEGQQASIQATIQQLSLLERRAEDAIARSDAPGIGRMNEIVSKQNRPPCYSSSRVAEPNGSE